MPYSANLLPSLNRFLEAASVAEKWRIVAPTERRLQAAMSRAFRAQGRAFLGGFESLRGRFQEAITERDWISIFDAATGETFTLFSDPMEQYVQLAMLRGAESFIAELGVDTAFNLRNPRAVAYLQEHGFGLISQINEVTRGNIATIVQNGVAEGWGYDRMADDIRSLYGDMSLTRARLIAVTEAGEAYETGTAIVVQDLQDAGLRMEKQWLTVGDNRVSEGCQANTAEGWIPFSQAFSSGHMHPLRFPGCRCTTAYRRIGA